MHQNQASNAPVNEVTRLLQMVRPGVPFPVADVVIVPLLADLPFAADYKISCSTAKIVFGIERCMVSANSYVC